jgi:hypothetical protein
MKFVLRIVPAVLALSLVAGWASAQTQDDIRAAIERTDDVISRAQEVVGGSGNAEAEADLQLAIQLQTSAKAEFSVGHNLRALDLTKRARLAAERAVARITGGDGDRVLAQLERTANCSTASASESPTATTIAPRRCCKPRSRSRRAPEAAASEKRWLAALRLTMSARERAMRALRLCNLEDNLQEAAERALTRTDEIIGRAKDAVSEHDSEPARPGRQPRGRAAGRGVVAVPRRKVRSQPASDSDGSHVRTARDPSRQCRMIATRSE